MPTRPSRFRLALRSAAFNVGMYLATAAIAIAGAPLLAAPRAWIFRLQRFWIRTLLGLLRLTCGLDHEVRGRENLPPGPVLIAAKHQSSWETLALAVLVPGAAFVVKRDLLWIPVVGWFMARTGCIGVDRSAGASALRRLLREAAAAVGRGQPIVIFPEGTRAPLDATLPFQPGVAALYGHLGLPVVPVALNSGVFWGRRQFIKRPGRIVLEFLPAIPPGLDRRAFMRELQARLEEGTARLVAEGRRLAPPVDKSA